MKITANTGWTDHSWQVKRTDSEPHYMVNITRESRGQYEIVLQRRDLNGTYSNIVRRDTFNGSQKDAIEFAKDSIEIWES